jgi:hypothetical protein
MALLLPAGEGIKPCWQTQSPLLRIKEGLHFWQIAELLAEQFWQ